jgi:hypothetical protein
MKLVSIELHVFPKVNINPVFQILGHDRSRFIFHVCPSAIKQTTRAHSPRSCHLPHTLPQLGDGFLQGEYFSLSEIESP